MVTANSSAFAGYTLTSGSELVEQEEEEDDSVSASVFGRFVGGCDEDGSPSMVGVPVKGKEEFNMLLSHARQQDRCVRPN